MCEAHEFPGGLPFIKVDSGGLTHATTYHHKTIDQSTDRSKMHANFKSACERFDKTGNVNKSTEELGPGQYNLIAGNIELVTHARSKTTYGTHRSVFRSVTERNKYEDLTDDMRDSNWTLDRDSKAYWKPRTYTKFANDSRAFKLFKSECRTECYPLQHSTQVEKYVPMGASAPHFTHLTAPTTVAPTGSRLFVGTKATSATKAECLDLSGCEVESCSEMAEVTQLCYLAAQKAVGKGTAAEIPWALRWAMKDPETIKAENEKRNKALKASRPKPPKQMVKEQSNEETRRMISEASRPRHLGDGPMNSKLKTSNSFVRKQVGGRANGGGEREDSGGGLDVTAASDVARVECARSIAWVAPGCERGEA